MKKFNAIGKEEREAADAVIKKKLLSGYIASDHYGGPECAELEYQWEGAFKVNHAVAVNSGTSGLLAACMAIEVKPGDDVIVSPYTMSATAGAPKVLGANVIWADIEPEQYNIDPEDVLRKITPKTKAVIATNLFGHPCELHKLREICDLRDIYLIEDNAQGIFASENDKYAGTIGHIGVFSLNVHKHLQVGEGGICVTQNKTIAKNIRAAMNHGEIRNKIIGLNLRMTEVTAAMTIQQLKKAPEIMRSRVTLAHKITEYVKTKEHGYKNLFPPRIRDNCDHSFYVWGAQLLGGPQRPIPKPFRQGYLKPLYRLKAFEGPDPVRLPVVEQVESQMVLFEVCAYDPNDAEIEHMVNELWAAL